MIRNLGDLPSVEPPLWAGLSASYHNADILDAEAEDLTLDQTEERIRQSGEQSVLIVVMGNNPSVSSTPKMPVAEALAERISDLKVSLTGLHPVAVGSKWPVVKKPFEGFPMMPWNKLPMHLYRAHNWHCLDGSSRSPYASIYTSLGCPFNCYYCNIHTLYGGKREVQFRDMADVAADLYILQTVYHVHNLKIWDELFALQEGRVIQFCNIILANGFQFNIWAYARLDTVTEKMLKAMKLAGINWLAYGFESVSDIKFVLHVEDIIKMTRDNGINIMANFMFGAPGTTYADDQRSLKFAMKHLFEFVNFYDARPYPGSQWFKDWNPQWDWQDYGQFSNISSFRQKAFEEYFSNPAYLAHIGGKWGIQAIDHIRHMVEYHKQNVATGKV